MLANCSYAVLVYVGWLDSSAEAGKLDRLLSAVAGVIVMVVWPWVKPVSVEVRSVRSLRTQQRAQCQMPKTRLCFPVSSYFGVVLGVQRIPLEID